MLLNRIRTSMVCVHEQKILVFNAIDPHSQKHYWFLPGGKIEEGEAPWVCAERETLEETGYRVAALKESQIVKEYTHEWNGHQYLSKTFFLKGFLIEVWHEPRPVVDAAYNKGAQWMDLTDAIDYFGYCPEIQAAVRDLTS